MPHPHPPPPPPPPADVQSISSPLPPTIKPPSVAQGPPGSSFLVELLVYNGAPFMDHWAYFVRSPDNPDIGVLMQASGDVLKGFSFDIERSHDLRATGNRPTTRTPLQWVDKQYFQFEDQKSFLNNGVFKLEHVPGCIFEATAYKVQVPDKSLNVVDGDCEDNVVEGKKSIGKKIVHRNCQTWIVESADQLVEDGIFNEEVAAYLHAIKQ